MAAENWELARIALNSRTRAIFLHGPPGTGKTYTAAREGLGGRECFMVTLTPETPSSEGRGHYMPTGGEFMWSDGVFIRAMREGHRLVLNEISHASEDVLAILYPLLEGAETARLTLPTGETVHAHERFQCVVTDNNDMDSLLGALQSRLAVRVHIDTPHPAALAQLPEKYREAARRGYASFREGSPESITMRSWLAIVALERDGVSPSDAFALAFGRERGLMIHESLSIDASA